MNFQNAQLPDGVQLVGKTKTFTEGTVLTSLLANHMAPKGKHGLLVVEEGACQFVWEDDPDTRLDCDPDHPIVIFPERYHHVVIIGPVKLWVEFYSVPTVLGDLDPNASRPGQDFL